MPPVKNTPPAEKPAEDQVDKADIAASQPEPGTAVLLPDGGEAILLGFADGEALLRCGTLHDAPVRRPAGQISAVEPDEETRRHAKFRREALSRGEITLPEPASAE